MLLALAVISTLHLEGDVTADGGDYVEVPFVVPAGTVEMTIAHANTTSGTILDFGVWQPSPTGVPGGDFRGWGGGLTEDTVIGVMQSSRGYIPGPITADSWTLVIGKAELGAATAHYTADITFNDVASLPVQPQAEFTPVVMSTVQRWYKGDFHVHDSESGDSKATFDEDVTLAMANGLDFANFSDHNTISQHALIAAQQASWPILPLRGSEITTYSGHANVVGNIDYIDHRLGLRGRTITDVVNDAMSQGGMVIVNHPATNLGTNCIGCPWGHEADAPWDDISGIEVLTSGWEVGVEAFTPTVLQLWDRLETAGHRIAAVSGSDDHTAGMNEAITGSPVGEPCTNVLADELSEAGIMAAVRARHTFVQLRGCSDVSVIATMTQNDGTTANVGDEVDGVEGVTINSHIVMGDGDFAQVWRDGVMVGQQAISGNDYTWTYKEDPGAATHRYRIEIINNANRRLVITSHFYVTSTPVSGGGCAAGDSRGGLLAWLGVLGLVLRRRRARS